MLPLYGTPLYATKPSVQNDLALQLHHSHGLQALSQPGSFSLNILAKAGHVRTTFDDINDIRANSWTIYDIHSCPTIVVRDEATL